MSRKTVPQPLTIEQANINAVNSAQTWQRSTGTKSYWDNFFILKNQLDTSGGKARSPVQQQIYSRMRRLFFGFVSNYINRRNIRLSIEEFLKDTLPKGFWKLYVTYIARRKPATNPHQYFAHVTIKTYFLLTVAFYRREIPSAIDEVEIGECYRMVANPDFAQKHHLRARQPKNFAQWKDISIVISQGVFGSTVQFKSMRERVQMAAMLGLLAFTVARPGEIICPWSYLKDNEGIHYGDLDFFLDKCNDGTTALLLNVKLRNLKGCRSIDRAYRIQGLYQDRENIPPLMDPTLLLAMLAIKDGCFEGFQSLHDIFTTDLEKVARLLPSALVGGRLKLNMKDSVRYLPVFRNFKYETNQWWTHPNQIWPYDSAQRLFRRLANSLGFMSLTFYDIRRGSINALNTITVTEDDLKYIAGHTEGSSIWINHYQSKLSKVDIQGLAMNGQQNKEKLVLSPIERLPSVTMSLDEMLKVEQDPALLRSKQTLTLQKLSQQLRDAMFYEHINNFQALGILSADQFPTDRHSSRLAQAKNIACLKEQVEKYMASTRKIEILRAQLRANVKLEKAKKMADYLRQEAIQGPKRDEASESGDDVIDEDTDDEEDFDTLNEDTSMDCEDNQVALQPDDHALAISQICSEAVEYIQSPSSIDFGRLLHIRTDMEAVARELSTLISNCNDASNAEQISTLRKSLQETLVQRMESLATPQCTCHMRDVASTVSSSSNLLNKLHWDTYAQRCPFLVSTDRQCQYQLQSPGTAYSHGQYQIHLQQVHGVVPLIKETVDFCVDHAVWSIGTAAIEAHYESHLETYDLSTIPVSDPKHVCPFCWCNTTLKASQRARYHQKHLSQHIITQHLATTQSHYPLCPICANVCSLNDFADHIIEHGYVLAGYVKGTKIPKLINNNLLELFHARFSTKQKQKLSTWITYVQNQI